MKRYFLFALCSFLIFSCASEKDYLITFQTRYGNMKAILYDATPQHKENFIKLAQSGAYDSTTFHRVIRDFMIQAGDVNAKTPDETPIDYTIPAEFNDTLIHEKGALAAARQADQVNPKKESSGSQFYIIQGRTFTEEELNAMMYNRKAQQQQDLFRRLLGKEEYADLRKEIIQLQQQGNYAAIQEKVENSGDLIEKEFGPQPDYTLTEQQRQAYTTVGGAPHLDRDYTVFGQVVEGMPVIDSIANVVTGAADKPVDDVYMTVKVEELSKKELRKRYSEYYSAEKK
ncbi:peptidylprolyl isomerase [Cesiribacter sp. SM1]|uniref:peptidylprolyl isomerase n=1 Tax=Cesiribacter sp. SM1 TaxID=2861196 RepID=UPI001CD3DF17|nr:peptidylprolyl isomerase [Cesiribacter sp. SM1]